MVSVTEFLTDGQRNVLPGNAVLKGDVRARSPEDRDRIEAFMRQIAEGIALAHGVSVQVDFQTEFIDHLVPGHTLHQGNENEGHAVHVHGDRAFQVDHIDQGDHLR